MNKKKSKTESKTSHSLPPLVPPEIEQKLYQEMGETFGLQTEGEYTVSVEFGIEESESFNSVMNLIRDHDRKQVINRYGKQCYYVTYNLKQLRSLMDLYYAIQPLAYKDLYINHRKLPYAHSLWIQLFQLMA